MPYIEYLGCECNDVDEFNERASEQLEELCIELEKDPSNRIKIDRDQHPDSEHILFLWSKKAINSIEGEIAMLYSVGSTYFDTNDLDISTRYYTEE